MRITLSSSSGIGRPLISWGLLLCLAACDTRVYVRDGVTDGDRFSLPGFVYVDDDPVLQSWVAYSLTRSVCQLEIGGSNPARNSSFDCERIAREALVERWNALGGEPVISGDGPVGQAPGAQYLDELRDVGDAGYLDEYIWAYLDEPGWQKPDGLAMEQFRGWRRDGLSRGHRAQTRIIGSWGFASVSD